MPQASGEIGKKCGKRAGRHFDSVISGVSNETSPNHVRREMGLSDLAYSFINKSQISVMLPYAQREGRGFGTQTQVN